MRTCIGCRQRAPQGELVRLAVAQRTSEQPSDSVMIDAFGNGGRGRRLGRGAYLHPQAKCLERAVKRQAIRRAFRMRAGIAAELGVTVHALTGECTTAISSGHVVVEVGSRLES